MGLCVERSLEMVIGILGILKAGGAYVPLDPHNPKVRLTYQIEDADLNIVLTQQTILAQLPVLPEQTLCLDSEGVLAQLSFYSKRNPSVKKVGLHAHHLAYVMYTSGSTGQPKGVELVHRGVMNYLAYAMEAYFTHASAAVVNTSLSFDATVTSLLSPLVLGRGVYLLTPGNFEDELNRLSGRMHSSEEALLFKLTPAHLQALATGFAQGQVVSQVAHHLVTVSYTHLTLPTICSV